MYTYTAANVIDGRFSYGGSSRKTRYTVALVSFNDMNDFGRAKVVAVQDDAAIARYGIRPTDATAFGCTSEAQAYRLGQWILLTSMRETRSVAFSVGLDGAVCAPGQIIRVADPAFAGRRIGGRIKSATTTVVNLDAPVAVRPGDRLTVTLPNGTVETREVSEAIGTRLTVDSTTLTADSTVLTADMVGLPGDVWVITLASPYSHAPQPESIWTLESEALTTQLFNVISVTEGEGMTFEVSAVQHEPGKFAAIDFGTKLDNPPITIVPPSVQPPPTEVAITAFSIVRQGVDSQTAVITWTAPSSATAYEVEWRRDNSQWVKAGRTGATLLEVPNIYAGTYLARVRAINALESPSSWATSTETVLDGIAGAPPVVTSLTAASLVFGIRLNWGFPAAPGILERTEIWYSQTPSRLDAIKLGDFSTPQDTHTLMGLSAGAKFYFWARLVDKNGTAGEFYPGGEGVQGTASTDATTILNYLTNKITESQLGQALLEKINDPGGAQVQIDAIVNALAAMYTIKTQLTVDNVPYMAGIGVGVENNEGVITSQILLAAQRVAVLNEANGVTTSPFVIEGGQVFINDAVIGKLGAGHIDVQTLDAISANMGYLTAGRINVQGDGAGGWGYIQSNGKWLDDNWGWVMAQHPNGSMFIDMKLNGCGLTMYHEAGVAATFRLWGPGFNLDQNGLTISQANVINTLQLAGNAVTVPTSASAFNPVAYNQYTPILTCPAIDPQGGSVLIVASVFNAPGATAEGGDPLPNSFQIRRNGTLLLPTALGGRDISGQFLTLAFTDSYNGAAIYDMTMLSGIGGVVTGYATTRTLSVLGVKR